MTQYVQLVYNVSPNLHKAFATKYVPELFAAIQQNILGSPTNNVRNMGKDKIDLILNLMKQVLQRCYSPSQASSLTEDFGFQIALQLFNSDFLERKLQGIKHIQDFLKSNKVRSYISNNQRDEINKLAGIFQKNSIFEKLYTSNSHHLIQVSETFLTFMINNDLIGPKELEILWQAIEKTDLEIQLAIYSLLKERYHSLNAQQISFIVDKFMSKDVSTLTKDSLKFLSEITNFEVNVSDKAFVDLQEYFWKVVHFYDAEQGTKILECAI